MRINLRAADAGYIVGVCRAGTLRLDLGSHALADALDDRIPLDVVRVVCLELGGDTGQGTLEGLLGGSVDHLRL